MKIGFCGCVLGVVVCVGAARADLVSLDENSFPTTTLTSLGFDGLTLDTEVNRAVFNGVLFEYRLGGVLADGNIIIDGGPGTTNHVDLPNIVSVGDNTGVLTATLPFSVTALSYGFALLTEDTLADGTTVSAYDGTTRLGSSTFGAAPDPFFAGGFAGIQSTTPFDRVEITFNSTAATAFALDNLTLAAATPEPATRLTLLWGAGVFAVWLGWSRRLPKR